MEFKTFATPALVKKYAFAIDPYIFYGKFVIPTILLVLSAAFFITNHPINSLIFFILFVASVILTMYGIKKRYQSLEKNWLKSFHTTELRGSLCFHESYACATSDYRKEPSFISYDLFQTFFLTDTCIIFILASKRYIIINQIDLSSHDIELLINFVKKRMPNIKFVPRTLTFGEENHGI